MNGGFTTGQTESLALGEVSRHTLPDFSRTHRLPPHHWKVLRALAACHTPALGGHQYQCAHCGREHFVPHSCGNRHCPSCQRLKGAEWLEAQTQHLLPIPYFHVVFTLPHELNPLIARGRPPNRGEDWPSVEIQTVSLTAPTLSASPLRS